VDFEIPEVYVAARVTALSTGAVRVDCRDERGRTWTRTRRFGQRNNAARDELIDLVAARCSEKVELLPPQRMRERSRVDIPVALFFAASPALETLAEAMVERVVKEVGRVQPVALQSPTVRRRRFRLPLRIVSVSGAGDDLLAWIRSQRWFRNTAIGDGGMNLEATEAITATPTLSADSLIVVHASDEPSLSDRMARWPVVRRPRMVVIVGRSLRAGPTWPRGIALLRVPPTTSGAKSFLRQLVLAVVHDRPLHEAVYIARRLAPGVGGVTLLADPHSNQALRLADALVDIVTRGDDLQASLPPAFSRTGRDPVLVLDRAGEAFLPPNLREYLGRTDARRELTQRIQRVAADFSRERFGLEPLAELHRELRRAAFDPGELRAPDIMVGKGPARRLRSEQRRRVNIVLARTEFSDLARDLPAERRVIVEERTVLREGTVYRLRVRIGQPSRTSLVRGAVPSIDLLLPGGKPNVLDVVVHGLDCRILGPKVRRLHLPPAGASDTVGFDVRTPSLEDGQSSARFSTRVLLYHRNHLLQSFLLSGQIEARERRTTKSVLDARLEVARTARFTNLDALDKPAISIAVNSNGPTHTVMTMVDGRPGELRLDAAVSEALVTRFRAIQDETQGHGNTALFPAEPSPSGEIPAGFEDAVWKLANVGRDVLRTMFPDQRPGSPLDRALGQLRDGQDLTVTVTRLDRYHAVPWVCVYDFRLPETQPRAPVCRHPVSPPGERCERHGGSPGRLCIHGFWGVRHAVEELVVPAEDDVGDATDICLKVTPPVADGVQVSDSFTTTASKALHEWLAEKLGGQFRRLTITDNLYDRLWAEPSRPAVLVVHGHLEDYTDGVGEKRHGVRLESAPGWFLPKSLIDRIQDGERTWSAPRPLVLLLACESATFEPATVADFVSTLMRVGASAVVGAEVDTRSGLLCRTTRELVELMWLGKDGRRLHLGEAMASVRRRLMLEGNPTGFAVSAFGSAQLVFGEAP
jgi:hypothetical protein